MQSDGTIRAAAIQAEYSGAINGEASKQAITLTLLILTPTVALDINLAAPSTKSADWYVTIGHFMQAHVLRILVTGVDVTWRGCPVFAVPLLLLQSRSSLSDYPHTLLSLLGNVFRYTERIVRWESWVRTSMLTAV